MLLAQELHITCILYIKNFTKNARARYGVNFEYFLIYPFINLEFTFHFAAQPFLYAKR